MTKSKYKFDNMNYEKSFAKRLGTMHRLVSQALNVALEKSKKIIDIGGGSGIGASLVNELDPTAKVLNIEPASLTDAKKTFVSLKYSRLKMSFKEALKSQLPWKADLLMMVSAAHEIALCNNQIALKNKKIFLGELRQFVSINLKSSGKFIIGFPNYRENASEEAIEKQRRYTESLLGHSHPREEFFTLSEFTQTFNREPIYYVTEPMILKGEAADETMLIANVAIFEF